jgi:hypothetical protein
MSQQTGAPALSAAGLTVFRRSRIGQIGTASRPVRLAEAVAMAELFGTTLDVALGLNPGAPHVPSWTETRRTVLLQHIAALIEAEMDGA